MSKYDGHTPGPWTWEWTDTVGVPQRTLEGPKILCRHWGLQDLPVDGLLLEDAPKLLAQRDALLAALKYMQDRVVAAGEAGVFENWEPSVRKAQSAIAAVEEDRMPSPFTKVTED